MKCRYTLRISGMSRKGGKDECIAISAGQLGYDSGRIRILPALFFKKTERETPLQASFYAKNRG